MIKDTHEIYEELAIGSEVLSVELQIELTKRITKLDEMTRSNQVNQDIYQLAKEIQSLSTRLRWTLHYEMTKHK
jgi:hypothetical protein